MRRISIIFFLAISFLQLSAQQPDWENHYVLHINREPARAAFIGYGSVPSDRQISLDGQWKFHWSPTPEGRIADFYSTTFNDKDWKTFPVPTEVINLSLAAPTACLAAVSDCVILLTSDIALLRAVAPADRAL